MNASLRLGLLFCAVTWLACSPATPAAEQTARQGSGLTAPPQVPLPCAGSGNTWTSIWNGTVPELYFADAIAQCSALASGGYQDTPLLDTYAGKIEAAMGSAVGAHTSLTTAWATLRTNPIHNCDQGLTTNNESVSWQPRVVAESIPFTSTDSIAYAANADLRTAGVNLCIAQLLTQQAPGTAGGESLLFSAAEQRELLETARERAQISMLQYAILGEIFILPSVAISAAVDPQQRLPNLIQWSRSAASSNLSNMGGDFSAAVQLDVTLTQQMASLLARSRSANLPIQAQARAPADSTWGFNSWYQRELALMYGGDPLAIDSFLVNGQIVGTGAWANGSGVTMPGPGINGDWPAYWQQPYVVDAATAPQVNSLLSLARAYDVVTLKPSTSASTSTACNPFDPTATGNFIYSQVEYQLELNACAAAATSCPTSAPTIPSGGNVSTWLLSQDYQISPSHAQSLGQYLVETLTLGAPPGGTSALADGRCQPTLLGSDGFGDTTFDWEDYFSGALALAGQDKLMRPTFDPSTGHVSPQATFVPRPTLAIAPGYGRFAGVRFSSPGEMGSSPYADVGSFGLAGVCAPTAGSYGAPTAGSCLWGPNFDAVSDSKRRMGAVASLVAVRTMLLDTLGYSAATGYNTAIYSTYLQYADDIIKIIGGAVGEGVSIRPAGTFVTLPPESYNAFDDSVPSQDSIEVPLLETTWKQIGTSTALNAVDYEPVWSVTVDADASDAWWNQTSATYVAYALGDNQQCNPPGDTQGGCSPYAADLAVHPEVSVGSTTIASLVALATQWGLSSAPGTQFPVADMLPLIRWRFTLPLSYRNDGTRGTLVVARTVPGSGGAPPQVSYALLAGNFDAHLDSLNAGQQGQYYGSGGSLGVWVQHQTTPYGPNPQEAEYDGFDQPKHWVPPFNAELIGGSATDTSSSVYLSLANSAATSAVMAVNTALTNMQTEQTDLAAAQNAAVQASTTLQQNRDGLCGPGNGACDTTMLDETLNPQVLTALQGLPSQQVACQPTDDECAMHDLVVGALAPITTGVFEIAEAVDQQLGSSGVPSFSAYNGGSLQAAFIAQWNAVHTAVEKANAVAAALTAGQEQVSAANTVLAGVQNNATYECSPAKMAQALDDCTTTTSGSGSGGGFGISIWPPSVSFSGSLSYSSSTSTSWVPLDTQTDKCLTQSQQLPGADKTAAAAKVSAIASVEGAILGVSDAVAAIGASGATVESLLTQAKLADARASLEANLTQTSLQTSTGLWRVYTSADAENAVEQIENARRYALAARRAIEAQYVVDLSTMSQDEAFVTAPATWADSVYQYDLNMPTTVGLQVGGSQSSSGGVDSNELVDYVNDLQGFVAGYTVQRPTAIAQNEIDILNVAGLNPGTPVTLSAGNNYYPASGGWQLHCPPDPSNGMTGAWIGVPTSSSTGDVDTACTIMGQPGKPDQVKLDFTLDPWGELYGSIASTTFANRYNVRWTQLAVNFVGTGVKNCVLAADPQSCYTSDWIAYDLTHVGPSWVSDFYENWDVMNTPKGVIEGGKGLAAEIWLDPLQDGWATTNISAIARTEYEGAPVGGGYELSFAVPPEVVLSSIQYVQIMLGSDAWVAQQ